MGAALLKPFFPPAKGLSRPTRGIYRLATTQHNTNTNTNTESNTLPGESLQGEISTTVSDIMGFNDTGNAIVNAGREENFISNFSSILPDTPNKDIETIMARYDRVGSYNFLSSGINSPFDLGKTIRDSGAFAKLDGFLGFTGTFSFRIAWNTEPFTQGLYILGYVPPGAPMFPLQNGDITSQFYSTYLSGCHHVVINIAESTSATLDVPYVGPRTFIPCGHSNIPLLGNFFLVPIVPVKSSTTLSEVRYTVYMAIKDFKSYGAFPAKATLTQSVSSFRSDIVYQSKVEALEKQYTVSKAAGSISSFLENAGQYIPSSIVPTAYIKSASFAAGGLQKIADLLGFSKPLSIDSLSKVHPLAYSDVCVSDATFSGAKFAMNSDAALGGIDLSGRGVDEMQLSEVLSRFNYFDTYEWKIGDAENHTLHDIPISPRLFAKTFPWNTPDGSTTAKINTQLSFVASAFLKWRGSIKLRFAIVGTKFHSGRLRLIYFPQDNRSPVYNSTQYMYTHIIDIRDPTSWEFEIPFIFAQPWCSTTQTSGTVSLLVENPLISSGPALDHVDVCLFVAGGSTFELAIPSLSNVETPQFNYSPPSTLFVDSDTTTHTSVYQSPLEDLTNNRYVSIDLAPKSDSSSVTAHSLAVGDPVRSLRPLFKRFAYGTNPYWSKRVIMQLPIPLHPNIHSQDTDYIAFFSCLFNFWRGGFRVYAQNVQPARAFAAPVSTIPTSTTVNGQIDSDSYDIRVASVGAAIGLVEATKVEVPYSFSSLCQNTFLPFADGDTSQALVIDYWNGHADSSLVCRAMADDFSMGFLIGAPITL